jgi:MFS family permease
MKYQGFFPLFLSSFAILFVGFGLFPLLPVYAAGFGATPTVVGFYLAATYSSITLGTLLSGWLPGYISRKLVFICAGLLGAPALILMGHATALWQVILLTCVVWFTGGIGLSLISVFIGLRADDTSRGRWFSLVALTNPLGAVIGGSVVSWIVGYKGYSLMFTLLGFVYAIWPLVGLLKVQDQPIGRTDNRKSSQYTSRISSLGYRLLLLAVLCSALTISVVRMGLSLSMKASQFSPSAISGSNVIGGLVTIPVVLAIGGLSDRLGKRLFLALGYLLAVIGSLVLLKSTQIWHFWIVAAAVLTSRTISSAMAPALATDILPKETLQRYLPILNTMAWLSGVLGFAATGFVFDTLGPGELYLMAASLSMASIGLIYMMSRKRRRVITVQNTQQPDYTKRPLKVKAESYYQHNNHIMNNSASRRI